MSDYINWAKTQPHPIKLAIQGNHDRNFRDNPPNDWGLKEMFKQLPGSHFLYDESIMVHGLKIYGTSWGANERDDFTRWHDNIDVLLTH